MCQAEARESDEDVPAFQFITQICHMANLDPDRFLYQDLTGIQLPKIFHEAVQVDLPGA